MQMIIKYSTNGGHGKMLLNMENCFPCSKAWMKKVLKVVDMDPRSEELRTDLQSYLTTRLDNTDDEKNKKKLLGDLEVLGARR